MECEIRINSSIFAFNAGCKIDIKALSLLNDAYKINKQGHFLQLPILEANTTLIVYASGYIKCQGASNLEDATISQQAFLKILQSTNHAPDMTDISCLFVVSTFSMSQIIDRFEKPKFDNFHRFLIDVSKQGDNTVQVLHEKYPGIHMWINKEKSVNLKNIEPIPKASFIFHYTGETIMESPNILCGIAAINKLFDYFGIKANVSIVTEDKQICKNNAQSKLSCSICKKSPFKTRYLLKRHMNTCKNKPIGIFICTKKHKPCQKYYATKYNLARHLKNHQVKENLSPNSQVCRHWSRYEDTLNNLTDHFNRGHLLKCYYCLTNLWNINKSILSIIKQVVHNTKPQKIEPTTNGLLSANSIQIMTSSSPKSTTRTTSSSSSFSESSVNSTDELLFEQMLEKALYTPKEIATKADKDSKPLDMPCLNDDVIDRRNLSMIQTENHYNRSKDEIKRIKPTFLSSEINYNQDLNWEEQAILDFDTSLFN